LIGTKDVSGEQQTLKTVDKKVWLFLSRIHPDVTKDNVSKYISDCGISNPEVEKWDTRFNTYASFKATQITNTKEP